jgi:AbrB family looped-hinge helix DNA binding protein
MKLRARVSSKGQVTIPKDVRDSLGLCEGSYVDLVIEDGEATLRSAGRGFLDYYGWLTPRHSPENWEAVREEVARDVGRRAARGTRADDDE